MPRPALRPEELERFRRELCELALRRFADRGYEGVSVRALSRELGCSHATPYRYFRDKQHIFAAVRALAYERFAAALEAGVADLTDPEQRLRAMVAAYLRFGREEPHAYRMICEIDLPVPDEHPEYWAKELRSWEIWRGEVQHAVDAGLLQGDSLAIAHAFWAGIHGAVSLHLGGKLILGQDLEALARSVTDAFLIAYRNRRKS
jgi:AcrR family transcriptional regulator